MINQGSRLDLAAHRDLVALDTPFNAPAPATADQAPRLVDQ
jgi:hypothetical protein